MAHTQRRCSSSTDIASTTTTTTTTTTTPSPPPSRQHTPPGTIPAPLAPPDPVSGWPTPWLSAPDFARYMHALHASGWRIRFSVAPSNPTHSHSHTDNHTDNHPPTPRTVPELRKTFRCADGGACARFVAEVQGLMAQENHHCVVHVADAQVSIYTHTHSARPAPGSKSAPGLTLRDVRLAMLIDGLPSCGSAATDVGDASSTMLTWEGYRNSLRDSMAPAGM